MPATRVSAHVCREALHAEINMTPLIDVMLVLLIVFIVTIPSLTHSVNLDPRFPGKTSPTASEVIDLQIDFDGSLRWNATVVDRGTLQRYISARASNLPQPEVHIAVDRFVNDGAGVL